MSNALHESIPTIETHESEPMVTVQYLGPLSEFKLGNPNGIESSLTGETDAEKEERRRAYGEKLKDAVATVTDKHHLGCIDGRFCLHNHDHTDAEIRRRQVGGTGATTEIALNSGSSLLDGLEADDPNPSLAAICAHIDNAVTQKTGIRRSAHTSGCAGIKESVADSRNMAANGASVAVAEAVMGLEPVATYSARFFEDGKGLEYTPERGEAVRARGPRTADVLEAGKWSGEQYVEATIDEEPVGVEDLDVGNDENDAFHGHKENAIVFVVSHDGTQALSKEKMRELGLGQAFVVSIDASVDMSMAHAREEDDLSIRRDQASQAMIANIAKHAEVANRLAHSDMPVYFMAIG